MNSIAAMPKKPATPTKESLALKTAFENSGLTKAYLAEQVGVTAAAIRQWVEGERPVPVGRAKKLADLVGAQPGAICATYDDLVSEGNVVPLRAEAGADTRRPDLALRRVENDVDALRYAMASIVSSTVIHRPAEAVAVAAALRRSVPKKFLDRGFVHELLITLDAAARAKG